MYSRGLCAPSVLSLQRVIDAIRDGAFNPYETREGYFPNPVVEVDQNASSGNPHAKTEQIERKDDEPDLADSQKMRFYQVHLVTCLNLSRQVLEPRVVTANRHQQLCHHSPRWSRGGPGSKNLAEKRKDTVGLSWFIILSRRRFLQVLAVQFSHVEENYSQKYGLTKDFDPFNMCSLCKKQATRDGAFQE